MCPGKLGRKNDQLAVQRGQRSLPWRTACGKGLSAGSAQTTQTLYKTEKIRKQEEEGEGNNITDQQCTSWHISADGSDQREIADPVER